MQLKPGKNTTNPQKTALLGQQQETTFEYTSLASSDENDEPNANLDGEIEWRPFITINLMVILHTCSSRLRLPLLNQMLYSEFAASILGGRTVDTTSNPCLKTLDQSSNSTLRDIETVQDMTSRTIFYFELAAYSVGIFSTCLLGAFSTVLPRRVQVGIPALGFLARCVSLLVVIYVRLPVRWVLLGCLLEGLSGGTCALFLGTLLYTTDITPRNRKRTWVMSMLEGLRGLSAAIFNVFAGHLIQKVGFRATANFTVLFAVLSIVCILMLPDRKPYVSQRRRQISLLNALKTMMSPCMQKSDSHSFQTRFMVLMASGAFFLSFVTSFAVQRVRILYLMNVPFCWDAISIGWYQFGRELIYNISSILSVPLLYRYLPGVGIGILGAVSNMAEFITYAVASNGSQLLIAMTLSFGQSFPVNLIRGETSRLLGPELQGPLFTNLALLENMSFAVGTYMISIYTVTLDTFPGIIFFVFAAIKLFVILQLTTFQVLWYRKKSKDERHKLLHFSTK